jgi:glycogen phosphorylase
MSNVATPRTRLTSPDLGMDEKAILKSFVDHVKHTQGKDEFSATPHDYLMSAAYAVRDRLADRWSRTAQAGYRKDVRRVYYLSLEFLIGRLLEDGLSNLGIREPTQRALASLDMSLDQVVETEWDAGLGNGGLGRLAACFLDSMATLGIPAMGYGIRYEYGIFKQLIVDGAQIEAPDTWLRYGNPWELPRPEILVPVHFYGRVVEDKDADGRQLRKWVDTEDVMAMAYDTPIPGYKNDVVNTLRLWSAKATREFNLAYFNQGGYVQAVQDKNATEAISRILYPSDAVDVGRELRLKQEYFFVAATLQDSLRRHLKIHPNLKNLADKAIFQLNDTHPAVAVPELMRLLLDKYRFEWDEAWEITRHCFAYTNHTVLPEALECWSVGLFERVLPRHLQIIYEINQRFLEEVRRRSPGDGERVSRLSLIEENHDRRVRMANLAVVGSSSVNGVSALHSRILKERVFADFAALTPEKFTNETNGITPRRWLLNCNPALAKLITSRLGDRWIRHLPELARLAKLADDTGFQREWQAVKRGNKERLATAMRRTWGFEADPAALFDVQVKRLHEYKRQLLNALHIVALYQRLRRGVGKDFAPRTFLFAGKAAPAYTAAKSIIRLINAVGAVVNNDVRTNPFLRVYFLPNYGVSLAERIIPAADLSEQISTAGTEASGTGNMKLALNGALTIGTLDGANVEIREAVGDDNFFLFGHTYEEACDLVSRGYNPRAVYDAEPEIKEALDSIGRGDFSPGEPGLFRPLVDSLLDGGDRFLVLADFARYRACQEIVGRTFRDQAAWTRKSILNVAGMGRFSSDLTIAAYAREIWRVPIAL